MLRKLTKAFIKIGALSIAGAGLYHAYYQKKYPLIHEAPDEFLLKTLNDDPSLESQLVKLDWVPEANYTIYMNEVVRPYLADFLKTGHILRGDYKLAYEQYTIPDAFATVVIVHGFNEYKEKFQELIYYLLQKKIQVVVYDQRGHGASKLTEIQTQIDSQNFNEYVLDLKAILDEIVRPIMTGQQKLMLFSHSMGGAVTTSLVEQYTDVVDGIILNTPMFMIDTGKYPQSFTYLYSKWMSKLGYGRHYIPTTEAFDPLKHTAYDDNPDDSISNSQIREAYFHDVNVSLHPMATRGGSLNWLETAFDTTHMLLKPERLALITIPVLLIRAGEDTVVQKEGIFTAGHYLPNVERILMPDSKHQTYLDHDAALKPYMTKLIKFIQNI